MGTIHAGKWMETPWMLQILQRDEEAVCALLSKHTGCGMSEEMSHMKRDAEPGLCSLFDQLG